MQVSREPISQLAGVHGQIHALLPQVVNHHSSSSLIASKLRVRKVFALSIATGNRPQEETWHAICDWYCKRREFSGVASNLTCTALGSEGKYIKTLNSLDRY
jgi:hypothetical protein